MSDPSQMTYYTSSNEVTLLSLHLLMEKQDIVLLEKQLWPYLHYQSPFIIIAVANIISENG